MIITQQTTAIFSLDSCLEIRPIKIELSFTLRLTALLTYKYKWKQKVEASDSVPSERMGTLGSCLCAPRAQGPHAAILCILYTHVFLMFKH
jgi:hypothetical protein